MNDNKNSILMIVLKLALFCFVAILLLTLVNLITYKRIDENKTKKEINVMNFLIPEARQFSDKKYFKSVDNRLKESNYYYEAYDNNSKIISYIVSSVCNGYGGKMRIMIAFDTNLKILNVKLLDNSETFGLGKNAENEEFMNDFRDTNTNEKPLPKNKNMLISNDSITGSSITFNGIVNGINKAIELLKSEL